MKANNPVSKFMRLLAASLAVFLVVEVGALIFIDRSYLQENTEDIQVQKIDSGVSSDTIKTDISIDSSAEDIKASYDGKFIAYTLNGNLEVVNLTTGAKSTVNMDEDMKLGYYKWLYDRDQLIIAELSTDEDDYYAKLYNLNVKSTLSDKEPVEIRDTVNDREAKIELPYSTGEITDMDFSTSTVTTYLKITSKSGNSKLWKFNVPDENRAFSISVKKIGNMQCLKNECELLYENSYNGKLCMAGKGVVKINGSSEYRLVGFDENDNVYLAKGSEDSTTQILYGSFVEQTDDEDSKITLQPEMDTIDLGGSVNIDDIYVTSSGDVYTNDSAENKFKNAKTGEEITYKGELKTVYGKGFITVNDGKILQCSFS
jgi:WD40 repeat protein